MEYKMDPNRQPRFIIRSCFGGSNAAFVASGSEVRDQPPRHRTAFCVAPLSCKLVCGALFSYILRSLRYTWLICGSMMVVLVCDLRCKYWLSLPLLDTILAFIECLMSRP